MQELMIFEGHEVEVFELNGRVLFNPKHVAECLEIADVNSSVRNFNKKQLVKVRNSDVHNLHIRKFNNAGENFLTESGVYKLVFKSHKPNAEAFTDWIADEVLPTLRKTGSYQMPKQEKQADRIRIMDMNARTRICTLSFPRWTRFRLHIKQCWYPKPVRFWLVRNSYRYRRWKRSHILLVR